MINETIVALSTAPLASAIAIVRLSGNKTYSILEKSYNKPIKKTLHPQLSIGKILQDGKMVDEVVLACYFAPKSFTGEDLVEINCHGNLLIIHQIIQLCILHGARMAEKGEFTKKAFFHGKLDLIQAESINDLINANNENAINLALQGVVGTISNQLLPIKEELISLASHIDVNIDYPEYEDIEELTFKSILPRVIVVLHQLDQLLQDAKVGSIIKEGINVAIVGKPNVGKSSLLNAFLNQDKAIVSEFAGTTRDVVEGSIQIEGIRFNFFDTAGIHDTKDFIENIGIEKSREYIEKSDLVLLVVDGSKPLDEEDEALLKLAKKKKHLVVINKKDLKTVVQVEGVLVSSLYKDIHILKQAMIDQIGIDLNQYEHLALISNARQIGLLEKAKASLDNAQQACNHHLPIDIIVIDVKNALMAIQDVLGELAHVDLEDSIFSRFCLGK